MDSDQVFDHRKFDGGALQGGTAPTDTPRTDEKIGAFRVTYEKNGSVGEAQFTSAVKQWGEMAEFARTLELELAAARAEADELARRVAEGVWYWHASTVHPVPTKDIEESIARVRAEMEKEKGK